jgi:hypothetical protein
MNATLITFIIIVCIAAVVFINRLFIKEEDLIAKAEKNWFYHTLAKMTCPKYDGYIMGDNEKKAMEEFISKPSEYDRHPIGSYLKMRKELKGILATAGNFHGYKLNFNFGEIGTGLAVMALFGIVVTLGVIYG